MQDSMINNLINQTGIIKGLDLLLAKKTAESLAATD